MVCFEVLSLFPIVLSVQFFVAFSFRVFFLLVYLACRFLSRVLQFFFRLVFPGYAFRRRRRRLFLSLLIFLAVFLPCAALHHVV